MVTITINDALHYVIFVILLSLPSLGSKYPSDFPVLEPSKTMYFPQCERPSFTPI